MTSPDGPPPDFRRIIPLLVALVVAVLVVAHVASAIMSRGNPPAVCQLLGGHWDIWNGWRCG